MSLVLVTGPQPLMTVAEAKRALKVEHAEHDWLIDAFLQAATDMVDGPKGRLGRALGPQIWDWYVDVARLNCGWKTRPLEVPLPPLIAVTEIEYRDSSGNLTAYTTFTAQGANGAGHGHVWPDPSTSWPDVQDGAGDALRIRFQAGYAIADGESPAGGVVEQTPWPIKTAILMMVADLYKNRDTTAPGVVSAIPMSTTVERLLAHYSFPTLA